MFLFPAWWEIMYFKDMDVPSVSMPTRIHEEPGMVVLCEELVSHHLHLHIRLCHILLWYIIEQLLISTSTKGSVVSDKLWTNRTPLLHTDDGEDLETELNASQSSTSYLAHLITELFPMVCFAKSWKGQGKWDCGNIISPLSTCYLFNIDSLQKENNNNNKFWTETLGILSISEDVFKQT